ncbi:MAG: 1-acyl-sn-glycerol-3-phosphate acyltransferase [Verrucomicrobia bacterium]|nr:1-acyl-sn-glycerol-3-phosphate acyltransferase [Verrucomicrobiota bacterium]MBI3869042.1 1-acyl-sn-glycerol-3-phosphate acyltransferase [Verrucomicrobiota bacterium]
MIPADSSTGRKTSTTSLLDPRLSVWRPPDSSLRDVIKHPMPGLPPERWIGFWVRSFTCVARSRVIEVRGLEHIRAAQDPFILTPNHSQRLEAMTLPALLAFIRDGKVVHFFADWLVMLYPIIGRVVRMHGPIVVGRKSAKIAWLNRFRSRFVGALPPFEQAANLLHAGESVAIFPEGTMNRDPKRLLRGYSGAAQLSLKEQAAVVPAGIRFPRRKGEGAIGDWDPWVLEFGPAMRPPSLKGEQPEIREIRDWHAQIMQAISSLSGKQWTPENQRTRYVA